MSVHPIQKYRESHTPPLSREALAQMLDVDRITVWRWENDHRRPDRKVLPRLAEITGIPVEILIGLTEPAE